MKKSCTAWLLFSILALTWGSSFFLMKLGLRSFPSEQIGMMRIAFASWFLLLIGFKRLARVRQQDIIPLLMVGVFGSAIPYTLFPIAVSQLDSGLVGVLNSLVPLFTLLIAVLVFNEKVRWRSVLGITIGLIGALWLLVPGMEVDSTRLIYGSLPVIATVGYAISINVISARLQHLDSITITMVSLLMVGLPATLYLLTTDFLLIMRTDQQAGLNLFYVALLGVFGTSLAVVIFNQLIKSSGSLFAASVTYAIPVVAMLWGVVDGEAFGWHQLIGMSAILYGVYLVNRRKRKRSARQAEQPPAEPQLANAD